MNSEEAIGLCCLCGVNIKVNEAMMCLSCLKGEVNVEAGFEFTETCNECRDCGRWLDKGGQWIHADFESRELLNICLKKVGGLNQRGVKLADALWIYTEPHSKRLKIKLTIHREVLDRAVIAHDLVIELKKNLANKIFGYLTRCEFWLKLGW